MVNIKKQAGFIITAELVLLATIMFIASVIGLVILRDALVQELLEVAEAIEVSEDHAFDGIRRPSQSAQYNTETIQPAFPEGN